MTSTLPPPPAYMVDAEVPEAPELSLSDTSIQQHAARNWPGNWTWECLLQRVDLMRGNTLQASQLYDLHIICQAALSMRYAPTGLRASAAKAFAENASFMDIDGRNEVCRHAYVQNMRRLIAHV